MAGRGDYYGLIIELRLIDSYKNLMLAAKFIKIFKAASITVGQRDVEEEG